MIFKEIRISFAKKPYIFVIFLGGGGGVRNHCHHRFWIREWNSQGIRDKEEYKLNAKLIFTMYFSLHEKVYTTGPEHGPAHGNLVLVTLTSRYGLPVSLLYSYTKYGSQ